MNNVNILDLTQQWLLGNVLISSSLDKRTTRSFQVTRFYVITETRYEEFIHFENVFFFFLHLLEGAIHRKRREVVN